MSNSKVKLHPFVAAALKDPVVKGNINKFKSNKNKYAFFATLLRTRNIPPEYTYPDVLEVVRDASLYTVNISQKEIQESIKFYNYKPDRNDMKRQKYDVYIAPRNKD